MHTFACYELQIFNIRSSCIHQYQDVSNKNLNTKVFIGNVGFNLFKLVNINTTFWANKPLLGQTDKCLTKVTINQTETKFTN